MGERILETHFVRALEKVCYKLFFLIEKGGIP